MSRRRKVLGKARGGEAVQARERDWGQHEGRRQFRVRPRFLGNAGSSAHIRHVGILDEPTMQAHYTTQNLLSNATLDTIPRPGKL